MKRLLSLLAILPLLLSLAACGSSFGKTYRVFTLTATDAPVNVEKIDALLTEEGSGYAKIKEQNPAILSTLSNVTPAELAGKCEIYKFMQNNRTSLAGRTFLVCGEKVYSIGNSGYNGVKEIACYTDILYYIYDGGFGLLRSTVGSVNIKTGERHYAQPDDFCNTEVAFLPSEDGKTLGFCRATFTEIGADSYEVNIQRGDVIFDSVEKITFFKSIAG